MCCIPAVHDSAVVQTAKSYGVSIAAHSTPFRNVLFQILEQLRRNHAATRRRRYALRALRVILPLSIRPIANYLSYLFQLRLFLFMKLM